MNTETEALRVLARKVLHFGALLTRDVRVVLRRRQADVLAELEKLARQVLTDRGEGEG